jgi:hypothetical protein
VYVAIIAALGEVGLQVEILSDGLPDLVAHATATEVLTAAAQR